MRLVRPTEKAKRLLLGWSSWIAVVVILFFVGHQHFQVTHLNVALVIICVVTFALVYAITRSSSDEQ